MTNILYQLPLQEDQTKFPHHLLNLSCPPVDQLEGTEIELHRNFPHAKGDKGLSLLHDGQDGRCGLLLWESAIVPSAN